MVDMSVILPVLWTICFLFIIWKLPFFEVKGFPRWSLMLVFGVKLLSSCVLHYMYTRYYPDRATADIFKYFDDAVGLFAVTDQSWSDFFRILFGINCDIPEFQPYFDNTNHWTRMYEYAPFLDNRFIIRTNMFILFVSAGNIAVHYVFANFISLVGFLLIYKTFEMFYGKNTVVFILIFLMPSSLLWTSGILKECLTTFALGAFVYGFFSLFHKPSVSYGILFGMGILMLLVLKFFIFVALFPAITAFTIIKFFNLKQPVSCYGLILLGGVLLLGIMDFGFHAMPFFESFAGKRGDSINGAIINEARSMLPIEKIQSTPWNFIVETPSALWHSLAVPYLWKWNGMVQFVPALESALFFVLCGLLCFSPQKINEQNRNFFWFCICFSFVLLWEIGISTPIIGGIVRYKIPIFPFLYTTLAMAIDWKKIVAKLSFVKAR